MLSHWIKIANPSMARLIYVQPLDQNANPPMARLIYFQPLGGFGSALQLTRERLTN